jgi:hypothetical protein
VFARENNEVGTMSTRHVQRLAAGRFAPDRLRPVTARLLERFFGSPIEELLAPPESGSHGTAVAAAWKSRQDDGEPVTVLADELSAQGPDLLARADQTRHMMDRTVAERTVTPAQVDRIDHMVRLHVQACVTMPPW